MYIQSNGFTHQGGTRTHNEDAFYESTAAKVWVVADGMGGHQGGDIASSIICKTVEDSVALNTNNYYPDILKQALLKANSQIRHYAQEHYQNNPVGSTVVALMIDDKQFHIFWAGDSRCYLLRDGILRQLSTDHSQVEEMIASGTLSAEEAETHPLANVITRALGVESSVQLDTMSADILDGDVFLLCSDGITKEFNNADMTRFLQGGELQETNLAIEHAALVKKSKDNVTCVLVKINFSCYSRAALTGDDMTIPVYD